MAVAEGLATDRLRHLVHDCLSKHLYDSAAFFADKLMTLSDRPAADTYLLAQAFFMNRQYQRCLGLLRSAELIEADVRCRYLAAKCQAACAQWEECLAMLGGDGADTAGGVDMQAEGGPRGAELSDVSAVLLLRAQAHHALENHAAAARCYKGALRADPYCYEAFQCLVDQHVLSASEEGALVDALPLPPGDEWLRLLYRSRCKKYEQGDALEQQLALLEAHPWDLAGDAGTRDGCGGERRTAGGEAGTPTASGGRGGVMSPTSSGIRTRSMTRTQGEGPSNSGGSGEDASMDPRGWGLRGNLDVLAARADWLFHRGMFQECHSLTCTILERDPYALEHLPLHLAAALELRKKNDLYLKAHKLVEAHPDKAVSWFAVGCYYMCTQQYDSARRYFGKSTGIDKMFMPAWIGFGHAFAAQDESDQALAAYRSAARLFPGLHMPLVGMGMEYGRMNNTQLAEQMLLMAHRLCPADPLVCNELGVLAYRSGHHKEAIAWLHKVLQLAPGGALSPACEVTLVNLGHAYRKTGKYVDAIAWYNKALGLCPGQAGTYAALGYTHHLQGDLMSAIDYYHKALGLRSDDSFTAEMLTLAITDDSMHAMAVP